MNDGYLLQSLCFISLLAVVVSELEVPIPRENVKLDLRQQATKDHVLEELQHQIDTKNKDQMSPRELQFHYFKLHDFDNNNLLDGLEIVKAIKHTQDEHGDGEDTTSEDELVNIVDGVLNLDDHNHDGYISFYEFMSSQGSDAAEDEDGK